jgi:hypothetical protein
MKKDALAFSTAAAGFCWLAGDFWNLIFFIEKRRSVLFLYFFVNLKRIKNRNFVILISHCNLISVAVSPLTKTLVSNQSTDQSTCGSGCGRIVTLLTAWG